MKLSEMDNERMPRNGSVRAYRDDGTPVDVGNDDYSDWQYEVANGDTVLSLVQFLEHRDNA